MRTDIKTAYMNIVATFLVIVFLLVSGCIFIFNDAAKLSREKFDMMSGLEQIDFYNANVLDKSDDQYISENLRVRIPMNMSEDDIIFEDNYVEKMFTITIPGADEKFLYNNPIVGSSNHISDLAYEYVNGDLKIEVYLDSVYEHKMFVDNGYMYFSFVDPRTLYDKIVVIDAGHGANIPGIVKYGVVEAEVNLGIALYLEEMLKDTDVRAYFTRTSDVDPSFANRVGLANDLDADMFISIHNNAAGDAYSQYNGTQVLYNEEDELGASKKLAEICLDNVVSNLGSRKRECINGTDIYIIRKSKVPVALVEVGFITNREEAENLADPEYQKNAARGLYEAIMEAYEEGL